MLDRHYAFAMHDLRRHGPAPFNEVWTAARNTPTMLSPPTLTEQLQPPSPAYRQR